MNMQDCYEKQAINSQSAVNEFTFFAGAHGLIKLFPVSWKNNNDMCKYGHWITKYIKSSPFCCQPEFFSLL